MTTSDNTPTKRCKKGELCVNPDGPELPATTDYFFAHKRTKDKLQPWCKMCHRAVNKTNTALWRKRPPKSPESPDDKSFRLYVQRIVIWHNSDARSGHIVGELTVAELTALYNQQQGLCGYCGIQLFDEFELDHMTPKSRGGTNTLDNVVWVCMHCNRTKCAKTFEEFRPVAL